MIDHAEF
jgi:KDEL-tailed cysteine endopeptidase